MSKLSETDYGWIDLLDQWLVRLEQHFDVQEMPSNKQRCQETRKLIRRMERLLNE